MQSTHPSDVPSPRDIEDALGQSVVVVYAQSPTQSNRIEALLRRADFDNLTFVVAVEAIHRLATGLRPDLLVMDPQGVSVEALAGFERITGDPDAPAIVWVSEESALEPSPGWVSDSLSLGDPDELARLKIVRALLTRRLRSTMAQQASSRRSLPAREGGAPWAQLTPLEESLLASLTRVAEFRVDPTGGHARRVGELAAGLALAMDMGEPFSELLQLAAPLHDIGTVGVPDPIITKDRPLGPDESGIMKLHTSLALRLLGDGEDPILEVARRVALGHHERWDGRGYPTGASGTDISIEARIVAVADSYEALSRGRSHEEALEVIVSESGGAFDPRVVGALVRLVDRAAA